MEIESIGLGINVAKADYFPQVSIFGRAGTNYLSAAQLFTEAGTIENATWAFVRIDNNEVISYYPNRLLHLKNHSESMKFDSKGVSNVVEY